MHPAANTGVSAGLGLAVVGILSWLFGLKGITIPEGVQADFGVIITATIGYVLHTRSIPILSAARQVADTVAGTASSITGGAVTTIFALALCLSMLAACGTTQHDQVLGTLKNINADVQVVAPAAKTILCLDAAGAVISGKILTDTGNDAGAAVSAGGAAIAQLCPAGSAPASP